MVIALVGRKEFIRTLDCVNYVNTRDDDENEME